MQYYGIETSPTPFIQPPVLLTAVFHSSTLITNDILGIKLRILHTQKTVHHKQGNKKIQKLDLGQYLGSEAWSEINFWNTLGCLPSTLGVHGIVSVSFVTQKIRLKCGDSEICDFYGHVSGNKSQAPLAKSSPFGIYMCISSYPRKCLF